MSLKVAESEPRKDRAAIPNQPAISSLFMVYVLNLRIFGKKLAKVPSLATDLLSDAAPRRGFALLRTAGWISAGAGALALGLFVGRELRSRYKFHRRTPYDFYAHSGDSHDLEFGVGI